MTNLTENNHGCSQKNTIVGIEEFINQIPVLPSVVSEAQHILNRPSLDLDGLVKVLEADPGTVAKILRIANSSFYGLSREIISVRHACIVLGQYTLRNVLITSIVISATSGKNESKHTDLLAHCIDTATIARFLANMTGLDRDVAYLAGLLHDNGSLFIENIKPDVAKKIREKTEQGNLNRENVEKELLGFDHAEFSAEVARYWMIPEEIACHIQFHHCDRDGEFTMSDLINMADIISTHKDTDDFEIRGFIDDKLLIRSGLDTKKILECINMAKESCQTEITTLSGT